jgi:WS/DGAT/MGAT family acyltransferase
MARYSYERLSPEAARLLGDENSRRLGHAGATLIFDAGPLAYSHGGVDFSALRGAIASRIAQAPGYHRKLSRIPLENHPVWNDDDEFRLDYHVRHTSLPRPGSLQQLRKVAARIQAQRLDRSRPLWEYWIVEGLEGGRFALLTKTHYALIHDTGVDALQLLLTPDANAAYENEVPFSPRPAPSGLELFYDEVISQARLPRRGWRMLRELFESDREAPRQLRERMDAAARLLGYSLASRHDLPMSGPAGPHRIVDYLKLPMDVTERVRRALGGSLLDVVVTTLAGAVGRYLSLHYMNPATLDFRVSTPVALDEDPSGGSIGEWIFELPIWESDATKRFKRVQQILRAEHELVPAARSRDLFPVDDLAQSSLPAATARVLASPSPVPVRIGVLPGPPQPLYLRGAKLEECYGHIPLSGRAGLGVSVFSYEGQLCWGLNADYDRMPDLSRFSEALRQSFRELERVADERPALVRVS